MGVTANLYRRKMGRAWDFIGVTWEFLYKSERAMICDIVTDENGGYHMIIDYYNPEHIPTASRSREQRQKFALWLCRGKND